MDAQQIRLYASCSEPLRRSFRGVYPRDVGLQRIASDVISPGAYIINTHSSLPGQHWVAIYKSGERRRSKLLFSFFDTYGRNPAQLDMSLPGSVTFFNGVQVQEVQSETCALYCLYFLHFLTSREDLSMWDIVKTFNFEDLTVNELLVQEFADALLMGKLN